LVFLLTILELSMTASAVTPLLSNHQAPLRQQKGYSIIELSIALAIISIILVTALAGVQRILRSNNVNEDLKNLNLMASKVTVMLTNVANTAGITQANLVNLRAFEGFRVAGNVVTNAFGGNITVVPNAAVLGTVPISGGLMVYSSRIPPEVCSDYITGLSPIASHISASNAANPAVAGAAYTNVVKTNLQAITIANLATACTAAAGNTITVAALIGSGT
jgi:prepilin-type N-terminal cleavage/methylation domain-containing protein